MFEHYSLYPQKINYRSLGYILLPMALLLTMFYIPLSKVLAMAFSNSAKSWIELVQSSLFLKFFIFTIYQAIMTVLIAMFIGTISGFLLAHGKPVLKNIISPALTVPFLLPPISILVGFVLMFEGEGYLPTLIGLNFEVFANPWSIITAHSLYNISVFAKISASAFENEPNDPHEVAIVMNSSWFTRFRKLTIPFLLPHLSAAALLTFLYAFNSFAVVLLLGAVKIQTLEVMIYHRTKLALDFQGGAQIAAIQVLINVLVVALYLKLNSHTSSISTSNFVKYNPNRVQRVFSSIFLFLVVLITWFPILLTISKFIQTFNRASEAQRNQLISGAYDNLLGTSPERVVVNTVFFGFLTGVIAVLITLLIVLYLIANPNRFNNNLISFFTILPMATSGIVLSFALLNLYGRSALFSQYVWVFILVSHAMASLPFSIRTVLAAYDYVPDDMVGLAKVMDAGEWQIFFSIILPIIRKTLLIAFLFSLAISIGEFSATHYLSRGGWVTISTAIGRLFNSRRNLLPLFYASILSLFAFILFYIVETIGKLEFRL